MLEVINYKSLKKVDIQLGKFNALIGLNASGKSNIIDCLAFLSESLQAYISLAPILDKRGGFKHVVFQEEKEITLSATFQNNNQKSEYYLKCIEDRVEERYLKVNGETIIQEKQGSGKYISREGGEKTFNSEWKNLIGQIPDDHALRQMNRWKFYSFMVPKIREESSVKKQLTLDSNGSNLAQVLLSLRTERPKIFSKIEDTLKLAVPEVEELLTPLTEEGKTYVAVREKGFKNPFDYHQLSDGTLRLLAYITALNLDVDLICFEEPENFVHPQLLGLLAEILKKSDKQIVLSTHSPYFLDHLEPEDLIIVKKEDGETKLRKVEAEKEKKEIKTLQEEGIPLGEAYYSGAI
nr:AAA family ATPase [Candidatus Freyarchaeota archaeon]